MKIILLCFCALFYISNAIAITEIRLASGQSTEDTRHVYAHKILKLALEATINEYGPFQIKYSDKYFTRNRALIELESGVIINVHEAPTREEWELRALPIRIPLRKGLLGYKLFLINKGAQKAFNEVQTVDDLKSLNAGLGEQWTVTKQFGEYKFNIVTGNDYEGLFKMLRAGRFDYFPRGVNEIFKEFHERKSLYPEMMIEPSKALYIKTPSYLFVSPANPKLAQRIRAGMEKIIKNGTFGLEFNREFGDSIDAADLKNRKIFLVENPDLSTKAAISTGQYWYTP